MTGLAPRELDELADHEAAIEAERDRFVLASRQRLLAIRDGRLYRAGHDTFESYCRDRWGMTRSHVDRLLKSQAVAEALTPIGVKALPESQARELAPLLNQPEQLREAWQQANTQTGGRPTAAAIRAVVRPEPEQPVVGPDPAPSPDALATKAAAPSAVASRPEHREPNPLAAARAAVARQPAMVAGKAVERLHTARLTFQAAGTAAEIVADLANDGVGVDRGAGWLDELDTTAALLADLTTALRRRNLRSVRP